MKSALWTSVFKTIFYNNETCCKSVSLIKNLESEIAQQIFAQQSILKGLSESVKINGIIQEGKLKL